MAAANMKSIKTRMKSVESTMQITKAMEMVASSKLRKAKENAERALPFYSILKEAIADAIASADMVSSPYLGSNSSERSCYIVIAGDRGLAGGYNNNLFKLVKSAMNMETDSIIPIGKKTVEFFSRKNCEKMTDEYNVVAGLGVGDALDISKLVCKQFAEGKYGKVFLVYTKFVNMLRQDPVMEQILPLNASTFQKASKPSGMTIYEPSEEEVLRIAIPQYISGAVYTAIQSSFASECAARRTAMNSANKNAEQMIENLTLNYNRARQASITQEITEIISGSEAL